MSRIASELELDLSSSSDFPYQTQSEGGKTGNEQQDCQSFLLRGAISGEPQTKALAFEITEAFFDLHA